MLSEKLTFSLTSLVVLLAFGLFYVVPPVMAHEDDKPFVDLTADQQKDAEINNFAVTLSVDETVQDVSSDDGVQIASGRQRNDRSIPDIDVDTIAEGAGRVILLAEFDKDVHLQILSPGNVVAGLRALFKDLKRDDPIPTFHELQLAAAAADKDPRVVDFFSSADCLWCR